MTQKDNPATLDVKPDHVREQLARILSSFEFKATEAQRAFLRFVVEKSLAGESQDIKGYTVATQVFGRSADFDQATDPIVSIQANKLRRALERYYLTAGRHDPVLIDMPRGSYVPAFQRQQAPESDLGVQRQAPVSSPQGHWWPTLLIRSFQNLTGDPELDYLAVGLATDLAMEITRYKEVRVIMQSHKAQHRRASDFGVRFIMDGRMFKGRAGLKVSLGLVEADTGVYIWGETYHSPFELDQLMTFQEDIAREVSGKILCETGIISKTLFLGSKEKPLKELTTYEAMLRYYDFNVVFTAEAFYKAIDALRLASEQEPECGLVWSMLARLYAANYSLELFDLETPIDKALAFATRGVQLEPASQRGRLILAFVLLLKNDLARGLVEAQRCYDCNPDSLIFLENIGYMMTLLGDWELGPALIRKAIQLNPYYSVIAHYPLWVDWVRQEDYQQAYLETLNFRTPSLFWDPLMECVSRSYLGKLPQARESAEKLLQLKPDFPQRGRILIQHYIKFDNVVDRCITGLQRARVDVD